MIWLNLSGASHDVRTLPRWSTACCMADFFPCNRATIGFSPAPNLLFFTSLPKDAHKGQTSLCPLKKRLTGGRNLGLDPGSQATPSPPHSHEREPQKRVYLWTGRVLELGAILLLLHWFFSALWECAGFWGRACIAANTVRKDNFTWLF